MNIFNHIKGKKTEVQELFSLLQQYAHEEFNDPPIDVKKIVEMCGIQYTEEVNLEKLTVSGSASMSNDIPSIWINVLESNYMEERIRFTIAHELGHILLHILPAAVNGTFFNDNKNTLNRQLSVWNPQEWEANQFAAKLLMPVEVIVKCSNEFIENNKDKFKEIKDKDNHSGNLPKFAAILTQYLAAKFRVSLSAMDYRLKNLKIIPS